VSGLGGRWKQEGTFLESDVIVRRIPRRTVDDFLDFLAFVFC